MPDVGLFSAALGLEEPWEVVDVQFDPEQRRLDLRIDFGNDARFLPNPHIEGGPRMAQSNLKSLVHLVHEIERVLTLERRQLWSESGISPVDLIAQEL